MPGKTIQVICFVCNITVERAIGQYNEAKKRQNTDNPISFCSKACATSFRFKGKPGKNKVTELKNLTKQAPCINCNTVLTINLYAKQSMAVCDNCATDYCERCNNPTGSMRRIGIHQRRFCNPCLAIWKKEYQSDNGFENSRKGGLISTAQSCKRSKNDIHFANLCEEAFDNVSVNDSCFTDKNGNNWDADVIIHDHHIAVLWNGVFHYKQIHKSQSLKQVKARDKIKHGVIKDNGYTVYIIKDIGKADPSFVLNQFTIFLEYIKSL